MPYGPHKITKVRQIALPAELLREMGLEIGDHVYIRVNPRDRQTVEVIPASVMLRRLERGTDAEMLDTLVRQDGDVDAASDRGSREG